MSRRRLPLLVSLPHAGLRVPAEVAPGCLLGPDEIRADSDEGSAAIYTPLGQRSWVFIATDIARVIVDLNRAADDRRPNGVVKRQTFQRRRVWRAPLSEAQIDCLLADHWHPYHRRLVEQAQGLLLGIDCHTMSAVAPPVSPDPGQVRPLVCIGDGGGQCPRSLVEALADCFRGVFQTEVSLNRPFQGGYITRSRPGGIPWVQLEISRNGWLSDGDKAEGVEEALRVFCRRVMAGLG